ncbi:maleylpyruvate isomerase N-terminal domain-containing protein [Propioniciclava sp.]|uniref:maleylpyruvate isomerase N-terminal domain-containing protein n=1 Tax=Propioniciclava sp. TaxID=2038686 RepID=UPI0026063233|nr:maleylpyruvate isomerase N-terminal domain-containing protein [Propioniciclava sp.]
MVDVLDWADYGEALGAAGSVLRGNAASAGLAARVPTCPDWTVADLVTHQGLVHRWAAGRLRGEPDRPDADVEAEASGAPDLLDWFDEGLVDLLNALAKAPADLSGNFFLLDAPPLRLAWARRQAHETTMHAVDAMAARLGRPPMASEVWFDRAFALDGLDELLTGFLPRPKYALTPAHPERVLVAPADAERAWLVELSQAGAVATRVVGEFPDADVTLGGSARALYLGLWNRGDEIVASDEGWLNGWQGRVRVTW